MQKRCSPCQLPSTTLSHHWHTRDHHTARYRDSPARSRRGRHAQLSRDRRCGFLLAAVPWLTAPSSIPLNVARSITTLARPSRHAPTRSTLVEGGAGPASATAAAATPSRPPHCPHRSRAAQPTRAHTRRRRSCRQPAAPAPAAGQRSRRAPTPFEGGAMPQPKPNPPQPTRPPQRSTVVLGRGLRPSALSCSRARKETRARKFPYGSLPVTDC